MKMEGDAELLFIFFCNDLRFVVYSQRKEELVKLLVSNSLKLNQKYFLLIIHQNSEISYASSSKFARTFLEVFPTGCTTINPCINACGCSSST